MTTIFGKPTNSDIYLNWNAFASDTWKRETLKTLVKQNTPMESNVLSAVWAGKKVL